MARDIDYKCSKCGAKPVGPGGTVKEMLVVKKVLFAEMGTTGRTLKTRVVAWLCPPCTKEDEAWLQKDYEFQRAMRTEVQDAKS